MSALRKNSKKQNVDTVFLVLGHSLRIFAHDITGKYTLQPNHYGKPSIFILTFH